MKRTIRVTLEKELEIEIPDDRFTDEYFAAFDGFIGFDGADTREEKIDELFEFTARNVFDDTYTDVEGVGTAKRHYMSHREADIVVTENYEDWEYWTVKKEVTND